MLFWVDLEPQALLVASPWRSLENTLNGKNLRSPKIPKKKDQKKIKETKKKIIRLKRLEH